MQQTPPAVPLAPLVEMQGLSVRFGNREILCGMTASLRGRSIGLLGPNGAGKSTLINTLLGFYKSSAGSARVFGYDVGTEIRKIRGLVGYMPENDAFISKMSAVSFVQMMGELSGLPSEMALERAHEALFYVGLAEARYRPLGTYSLGMKQLAKLAQAIVHGPKLLILDEPTNGLDPSARQRMIRMIKDIRDGREMRIVLCSHPARCGGHLRRGSDPETGADRALFESGRRAPSQQAIPGTGDLRRERRFHRGDRETRLRVRGDGKSHEDDSGGWSGDARHLSTGGGAASTHPADELPARHAGRYFSEGHGELTKR